MSKDRNHTVDYVRRERAAFEQSHKAMRQHSSRNRLAVQC